VERRSSARVGVDGIDGAGKTTLADELAAALRARGRPARRVSADDFHRPPAERYRRGRASPEGYYHDSFDFAAVRAAVRAAGDLVVAVVVGSTRDGTAAAAAAAVAARQPLSGRAVAAGPGRYRLDLTLAPSWARRACGRRACAGIRLRIGSGRAWTPAWTDADGTVSVIVPGRRDASRVVARIAPVERRYRALAMHRIVLTVSAG
jgi:hypothetical protein